MTEEKQPFVPEGFAQEFIDYSHKIDHGSEFVHSLFTAGAFYALAMVEENASEVTPQNLAKSIRVAFPVVFTDIASQMINSRFGDVCSLDYAQVQKEDQPCE